MLGTLVYAVFGLTILWSSAASIVVDAREYVGEINGSGGLGAVSVGVGAIVLPDALLVLGSIVANWMLSSWVRGSGGPIKTLHRIQRWAIVLPFVLVILVPIAFFTRPGPLGQLLLSISGMAWGLQFLLTAALLGMYAVRNSRAS